MKIIKIKKGFITNSSGSYEWLPALNSSSPPTSTPNALPTPSNAATSSMQSNPSPNINTTQNTAVQKNGFDPSVVIFAIIIGIAAIIACIGGIAKEIKKTKKMKKKK